MPTVNNACLQYQILETKIDRDRTAVVLVDDQNDFLTEGGKLHDHVKTVLERNNVVENLNKLLKTCRAKGVVCIHVPLQFSADYAEMGEAPYGIFEIVKQSGAFQKESWGAQLADVLDLEDRDIIVDGKSTTCAFAHTDLDAVLKKLRIETIVLGGLLTNICIESTMRTAYDSGYRVIALTDCAATISDDAQSAAIEQNWPMHSTPMRLDSFLGALERATAA